MTTWDGMPKKITVEDGVFPYVIRDESTVSSSVIVVSSGTEYYESRYVSSELFYIEGGSIEVSDGGKSRIRLKHSFASDVENDRSSIADFTISNLMHARAYSNTIVYSGWLTSVNFYPEEYNDGEHDVFNPFKNIEPYEGDSYNSPDYPYSPPQVTFGSRVTLPMQVTISLLYNMEGDVTEVINTWRDRILTAQREADVERGEQIRLEEEKRVRRAAEREAWLKTPEGQVEAVGSKFVLAMKKAYPLNVIKGKDAVLLSPDVIVNIIAEVKEEDIPKLHQYLSDEFWSVSPSLWKEFLNQAKTMVAEKVAH